VAPGSSHNQRCDHVTNDVRDLKKVIFNVSFTNIDKFDQKLLAGAEGEHKQPFSAKIRSESSANLLDSQQ
jgi:hypothetical protein